MAEDSNKPKSSSRDVNSKYKTEELDANRFSQNQQISAFPANANTQRSMHFSLAKKILDLLLAWAKVADKPYDQDPQQQQKIIDAIKGIDKLKENFEKEGKYVEAYIASRKSAALHACHQSAMGGHIKEDGSIEPWTKKNQDKFAAQAMKNFAVLCDEIDQSKEAKIALNDYVGAKGEKALAEIRKEVQSRIGDVMRVQLDKESQQLVDKLIDVDLQGVAHLNQARPQTPHERAQMDNPAVSKSHNRDNEPGRQPSPDRDSTPNQDRSAAHDRSMGMSR